MDKKSYKPIRSDGKPLTDKLAAVGEAAFDGKPSDGRLASLRPQRD